MEVVITQNKQELERLEGIIRENVGAFYKVGMALTKIRDEKYYCDVLGFETFEAYCKARWDFKKSYACYFNFCNHRQLRTFQHCPQLRKNPPPKTNAAPLPGFPPISSS